MNAFRNPAAVVCVHCHALISGDPAVFTRIGDLVEFGDCGRHKRTDFDAGGGTTGSPKRLEIVGTAGAKACCVAKTGPLASFPEKGRNDDN